MTVLQKMSPRLFD
jgi:hypothetical protein